RDYQMLHLAVSLQGRIVGERMSAAHGDHEILFVDAALTKSCRNMVRGDDRDIHGARLQLVEGGAPDALRRRLPWRWKQLTHADVYTGGRLSQFGEKRRQEHRRS